MRTADVGASKVRMAVKLTMNCIADFVEENNLTNRDFEILAYPAIELDRWLAFEGRIVYFQAAEIIKKIN